jgi:hypothetical protein
VFLPVFSDFSRISEEQHSRGRPLFLMTGTKWEEKSGKNSDPEQIFRGLGRTGGIILSSGVLRSKRMLTKENLQ